MTTYAKTKKSNLVSRNRPGEIFFITYPPRSRVCIRIYILVSNKKNTPTHKQNAKETKKIEKKETKEERKKEYAIVVINTCEKSNEIR